MNYVNYKIGTYLNQVKLIGKSNNAWEQLNEFNSDYILVFISTYYGIMVATAVCILIICLAVKLFRISGKQRNQLGMLIGYGCGMVFGISILVNVGENIGILPTMESFLPFISSGFLSNCTSYILVGLVMSIYRYKNTLATGSRAEYKKLIKE